MIRIIKPEEYKRISVSEHQDITATVREILSAVKAQGDEAVKHYETKYGRRSAPVELKVSPEEISRALTLLDPEYVSMLNRAADNIRAYHTHQICRDYSFKPQEGILLGQKVIPLNRVGIYIPGGTASYPSTVLMNAIPAKIAGCPHISLITPSPTPEILAAAKIAGVTEIFIAGGAQAIGALAYGTETIPKADKITGPGNIYVAEAKRQVYGAVDIDMIAGPSEILIIADDTANPPYVAADMLAQAEHDVNASAVLVTTSETLASSVRAEIERQIQTLPRKDIARPSIDSNGAIIIVASVDEAVNLANDIAPEHLEVCTENPLSLLDRIVNAGSIFLGNYSPEALGDYYAGANHTLPTMGTARFASPLGVHDFVKTSQYVYYDKNALAIAAKDIEMFAHSEGLDGHARSIMIRSE